MNPIQRKYCYLFHLKILLLLFFCFNEINTNAQAVRYSDTLIHSEEQPGGYDSEFQKENYFRKKSERPDQSDSFQLRQLPANELKKLKEDDAFWYANVTIKKEVVKETAKRISFTSQKWFQTLLWLIIIGGFAAFMMIFLANSNVSLFSRKNRLIRDASEEDIETDDIFAINYQKEIDKAIKNGNYRFAVRLLFLRLLRKLSDKNIIQYKQGSTNFDYLLQLNPTSYYKDFFRITRNYEYSWYGQFDVSPETFAVIQKDVENFENDLNKS